MPEEMRCFVSVIFFSSILTAPCLIILIASDELLASSSSEAMRMIKQGAVRIDEKKITDTKHLISSGTSAIYQVGKRKFKKITL